MACCIPRWEGDNNFMPVLAETRVMPQHLFESYDQLKPYFQRLYDETKRKTAKIEMFQIAPSTRNSNCFSRREKFLTKEARSK